jgi:DeoR/GlpR family transcriptional regulator of sugar metabolism
LSKIIKYIEANSTIIVVELALMLNISKRTVLRDIEKLKQKINWPGQVVKKADTGKL